MTTPSPLTVIVSGVAVCALVAAVTVLTWVGKVDGATAMTFLTAISSALLGVFAVSHGASSGAKNIARATGKPTGDE